jgi:prolipoprotein diacylglyceryltransferase
VWTRIPRLELRFGRRRLPAWTTLARVGASAGALVFASTAGLAGVAATVIAASIAASLASFVAWRAVGRRWRAGRYVLLEFAALACAATVATTVWLDGPVPAVLDRWMVAIAVCLAIGRIGCLCHGCCHGRPVRCGLHYPWLVPWTAAEEVRRVFPLQAIEASVLVLLATAGAWLASSAAGVAGSAVAAGYAVARFELEYWRGDARRQVGPLSHNQWWCIAIAAAVTGLGERAFGAAALVTIALLLAAHLYGSARRAKRSPRDLE